MTRTAYAAFDGSAALETRCHRELVLFEGGLAPSQERSEQPAGRLTAMQYAALLLAGLGIVAMLLLASFVSDALAASARADALAAMGEQTVVVQEGESLWSIASELDLEGASTNAVVSWISERNGLDSSLVITGQRLVVPA